MGEGFALYRRLPERLHRIAHAIPCVPAREYDVLVFLEHVHAFRMLGSA